MTSTVAAALRLTGPELAWLLALRPGSSATLVRSALALPASAAAPEGIDSLRGRGLTQDRPDETLPAGPAAVVGDVLTSANALVRIGTTDAVAAVIAVGRDRALLLAPDTSSGVEIVALDSRTPVGEAAAALAERLGSGASVMVAVPDGDIVAIEPGAGLAERVQERLP